MAQIDEIDEREKTAAARGPDLLARPFEESRTHLHAVAYRMLGSASEADDAVQEAWLRLHRADTSGVENLRGWLTTVVARVCLDMLRSRKAHPEDPLGDDVGAPADADEGTGDPEKNTLLVEALGPALLVVLEALAPTERLAFVLHDLFGVSFDEIAVMVGRSPVAARQLASRARRRVRGAAAGAGTGSGAGSGAGHGAGAAASRVGPEGDPARRRAIVDAFLTATRAGDFEALLALLDPDVVVRADAAAVRLGATSELRGAPAFVKAFGGRARGARRAEVDGVAAATWAPGGRPRVVFAFTIAADTDRILAIDLVADPERLEKLDVRLLEPEPPPRE